MDDEKLITVLQANPSRAHTNFSDMEQASLEKTGSFLTGKEPELVKQVTTLIRGTWPPLSAHVVIPTRRWNTYLVGVN